MKEAGPGPVFLVYDNFENDEFNLSHLNSSFIQSRHTRNWKDMVIDYSASIFREIACLISNDIFIRKKYLYEKVTKKIMLCIVLTI